MDSVSSEQSSHRSEATLLGLPAELRHKIFLILFPDEVVWSGPVPDVIATLLRTCKGMNRDIQECLKQWRPQLIVTDPSRFSHLSRRPAVIRQSADHITTLTFRVYHDVEPMWVNRASWSWLSLNPHGDHKHEGAEAWTRKMTSLPVFENRIESIIVDITPMPGWLISMKPHWLAHALNQQQIGIFFEAQVKHIVQMALAIRSHFGHVKLTFIGVVGRHHTFLVKALSHRLTELGMSVSTAVDQLPAESEISGEDVTIADVLLRMVSEEPEQLPGIAIPTRFHGTIFRTGNRVAQARGWGYHVEHVFRNCYAEDKLWTERQLWRLLIVVSRVANRWDFEAELPERRYMIEELASALKLDSWSQGEDPECFVIVANPKEESTS